MDSELASFSSVIHISKLTARQRSGAAGLITTATGKQGHGQTT
jgi:hypothetical protein